ncbi:MAG: fibrobacter succinogenes major paralogous domain-containing protein [Bacteroidetes bacterium]|nr:fibrobacter succinogenes major paralogous domain-containing protein [Bacteroidota bacterium]
MKQILSFSMLLLFVMMQQSYAQVSINTDGANPPPSAMLEVKSTDKGFLPPKMTNAQMLAISAPVSGIVIYNTDLQSLCWFDGNNWLQVTGTIVPGPLTCGVSTVVYQSVTYHTVLIGTQCWMKENLNAGNMITSAVSSSNNSIVEKWCYDDDAANCLTYGGLYTWDEMMQYSSTPGSQGICPSGWHIPTDAEWCTMSLYLDAGMDCNTNQYSGTDCGGKMKETGTTHWFDPNTGATNSSGFTALGAGDTEENMMDPFGPLMTFSGLKGYTGFWSSNGEFQSGYSSAVRLIWSYDAHLARNILPKTYGWSVRCLKN